MGSSVFCTMQSVLLSADGDTLRYENLMVEEMENILTEMVDFAIMVKL